ncbi:MAG: glycosyl transferase, partial [Oscillatoriales cyanobacterium]
RISEQHLSKASKVNIIKDSLKMFSCLLKIRYNNRVGNYD